MTFLAHRKNASIHLRIQLLLTCKKYACICTLVKYTTTAAQTTTTMTNRRRYTYSNHSNVAVDNSGDTNRKYDNCTVVDDDGDDND